MNVKRCIEPDQLQNDFDLVWVVLLSTFGLLYPFWKGFFIFESVSAYLRIGISILRAALDRLNIPLPATLPETASVH